MLTVHHLGISQSDRIVWLCEELDIPYTLVRYERDPVTRLAPPEYGALHPFGTAPVITDSELVLGESGAIIDYIVARHGDGRFVLGPHHPDFANYLFWYHFANASLIPSMMIGMIAGMIGGAPKAAVLQSLNARSDRAFAMIEQRLSEAPYFAGAEFSAADIMMMFPLTTMRMFAPRDLSGFPHLLNYLQRIGERPAFRTAMAKADPGFSVPLS